MVKEYDGLPMDRFELEVSGWIWNVEGESKFNAGELTVTTHPYVLEQIQFNVIERYRNLIRFPDPCPNCGRSGGDHDGECPTPLWVGKDHGIGVR